jgi:hypothetical protein
MRKLSRTRRALAVTAATSALAVSGLAVGAGSAHADGGAYACRSWNTKGDYYPVLPDVKIDSCYIVNSDGRTMWSLIDFINNTGTGITYCAHALNANNPGGPWLHDFGCGSSSDVEGGVYAGTDKGYGPSWQYWTAPAGTYVISAGFWLNGHYYGDVQSPRTTIG